MSMGLFLSDGYLFGQPLPAT